MAASSSSSSSGTAGAGGSECPPSTADCNQDGVCEANLLGDVNHCGECNKPCAPPLGGTSECVGGDCVYTCAMGTADCDQDPSNVCQDIMADMKNCGACGHDCFGGMCVQGECQPTLAYQTGNIASSLVAFGPDLYWGTPNGMVEKVGIDGSNPMIVGMVGFGIGVFGLAVTNQAVYATNGNRVTVFLNGGNTWMSINDQGVHAVAANNVHAVWTATGNGRVRRAEAVGGNQQEFAYSEMGPTSIVLDGDIARWANSNGTEIRESLVFDNNAATTIFAGPPNPRLLVQDDKTLYWVSNDMVYRGVLGMGMVPEPLFPTGPDVRALAVDGLHLYWTLGNVGEVWRAAKTAPFAPKPVAKGLAEPHSITIGADSVFWANRGDGTIMRLAR
jgi:hypothetical protein